ncbi:DMT family transporter [Pokkaliibacter plantistimulans]|nr:DMT family transporter [Pokkaliibacter plantistimulans]
MASVAGNSLAAPSVWWSPRMRGGVALALTLLVWASFFVSLRIGARASLPALDLALIRFAPAALVFLPLFIRHARRIAQAPKRYLLGIIVGGGLPYFLIAGQGMHYASVSDGSTLILGTIPLFVSAIAVCCYGERVSLARRWGLALILLGTLVMLSMSLLQGGERWKGHLIFVGCGLLWAYYTVSLRKAGLTPWQGASFLAVTSLVLTLLALLWRQQPLQLVSLPLDELLFHIGVQGVGVGLVSAFTFAYAITRLGAEVPAAIGSLTPVLASLLAVLLLGEHVSARTMLGMLLVVMGVCLASQLLRWPQRKSVAIAR